MILAAHECRVTNKPYLGICLGLQIAVIEFARNVLGVKGATSEEFSKGKADAYYATLSSHIPLEIILSTSSFLRTSFILLSVL